MIIGIGHDLCFLDRIHRIMNSSFSTRFMQRVLTVDECVSLEKLSKERQVEWVGGRFAAKEAVSKAFGVGIGNKLSFQDITITKNDLGKPICHISDYALTELGYTREAIRIHLSISHEKMMASAFVVIEQAS